MDRPPVSLTTRVLQGGTLLSAGLFIVGFVLGLDGEGARVGDPRRLDLVVQAVVDLQPWGWSTLGVLAIIATPAAGLLATAFELRAVQPRTALLGLAVLGILALAAAFALVG